MTDGGRGGRPLRNREFRALIIAQITSEVGDHFARVAVAGIAFERTASAFYAALAFVVGYLPGVLGSLVLGPLADRLPRKGLMLSCDLARAVLIGVLALLVAVDGPLWSFLLLLLLGEVFSAPFDAARSAVIPDVLTDATDYLAGTGLSRVLFQLNQVIGLAAAGVVVFGVSVELAMLVDMGTFVASFLVLAVGLRSRPVPLAGPEHHSDGHVFGDVAESVRLVFGDRLRRVFVLLGWAAAAFLIAPEGVALVYAATHGAPQLGGVLMAALPAGAAVGSFVVSRRAPAVAVRAIRPLLGLGCIPLLLTGLDLSAPATLVLWVLAGACQAFLVPIMVVVNLVSPPARRGGINGVAAAGFSLASAAAYLGAGAIADVIDPAGAVFGAGVLGLVVVVVVQWAWPGRELAAALTAQGVAGVGRVRPEGAQRA